MQKSLVQLEFKAAEKLYHFTCDPDSPIENVKLSLFDFLKHVGRVEDAIAAQQKAQAEESSKIEQLPQESVANG